MSCEIKLFIPVIFAQNPHHSKRNSVSTSFTTKVEVCDLFDLFCTQTCFLYIRLLASDNACYFIPHI